MAAGCLSVRLRYGLCSTWGTCDSVEPPPPRSPHWEGSGMEGSGCLSKHSSPASRGPHTVLAPKRSWPFEGVLTFQWVLPSALAVCQLHSIHVCKCICVCMCVHVYVQSACKQSTTHAGQCLDPRPPIKPSMSLLVAQSTQATSSRGTASAGVPARCFLQCAPHLTSPTPWRVDTLISTLKTRRPKHRDSW